MAAQVVSCLLVYLFLAVRLRQKQWRLRFTLGFTRPELLTYAKILLPLLASEFLWSLGENVYSAIYGNIGTQAWRRHDDDHAHPMPDGGALSACPRRRPSLLASRWARRSTTAPTATPSG